MNAEQAQPILSDDHNNCHVVIEHPETITTYYMIPARGLMMAVRLMIINLIFVFLVHLVLYIYVTKPPRVNM